MTFFFFPPFVASESQVQQKRRPLFSALAVIKCEGLSCAINVTQHIVTVSTAELLSALELLNAEHKVRQLLKINVLKTVGVGGAFKAALSPDRCF